MRNKNILKETLIRELIQNIAWYVRNPRKAYVKSREVGYKDMNYIQKILPETNNKLHVIHVANILINCLNINRKIIPKVKSNDIVPSIMCCIPYISHELGNLKLHKIFNNTEFTKLLSRSKEILPTTKPIYTLSTPSSLKVCNYSKFLKSIVDSDIEDILKSKCICETKSNHVNLHYGHIITGDIESIVNNSEVSKYLKTGSKFRNKVTLSKEEKGILLNKTIHEHKDKLLKRLKIKSSIDIENCLNNKIMSLVNKWDLKDSNKDVQCSRRINCSIKELHKNYIITIVDKASNNYAITCKKLYVSLIVKELGLESSVDNDNNTYVLYNMESEESILKRHEMQSKNFFNIGKGLADVCHLPIIYGIPKMHKNPIKLRFITGARHSSIKGVSMLLKNILNFFKNHFANYCNATMQRNGVYSLWSIDNSSKFINAVQGRKFGKKYGLYCADFTSLFTNLPHNVVIKELEYIVRLCFQNASKNRCNTHISKNGNSFKYTNVPGQNSFSKNDVLYMISYVLDNSYVKFGESILKQIKGIPQGSNASSGMADLTLMAMEHRFVSTNSKWFNHGKFLGCRYVDDLLIIAKDIPKIIVSLKEIYHESLTLVKTSTSYKQCNFLDLTVMLENNSVISKIYNKTDDYSFDVIKYPHYESNIPGYIISNVVYGEFLRFVKGCSYLDDYIVRCRDVLYQLEKN
ncbi:MAG: hypothetical protein LBE34_10330, partial [Flavobacteriaceae bacterium]|nr:hypothetical protein [Flavobacteriaceae bacterium]